MPRIATYGDARVAPARTTTARFRPADNDGGAFGAVAKGMQGLGDAGADYAETQAKIYDDLARTNTDAQTVTFSSEADGIFRDLKSLEGKAALDGRPAAEERLQNLYDRTLAGVDEPTLKYLQPRLDQYRAQYLSNFADHAVGQMRVYESKVGEARQANFADQAAANWDQPNLRSQFIEDGKKQLRANLVRQGLSDPEIVKAQERKYVSGIHSGIVDNFLVTGDIEGASTYLEANADEIDLADELQLRSALKGPLEQRQAAVDFASAVSLPVASSGETGAAPPSQATMFRAILGIEGGVDANGKFLTSPKGAVGPAQVMPTTAPEAARLAGVAWDEKKYRTDAAYNTLIGEAYFKEMLRQFKDPAIAAAAYNAGPNRVRTAMAKGGDWMKTLPSETQQYVSNFAKRTGIQQTARRWDAESVYATIDRKADKEGWTFERRERAKDYATSQISRDEQLLRRREEEADREASEMILNKGTGFTDTSQIPRSIWSNMSVNSRAAADSAARANRKPVDPPANSTEAIQLNAIRYGDPSRFRDMDLTPYVGKITRAELDSAISEQARMRGPAGDVIKSARDNISASITFNTMGDKALAKALDRKEHPEAYATVARDMEAYLQSVTGGKREPTDAETDAAFKRATMKVIVPASGWFGSDREMPRYEVETGAPVQVRVPVAVRQRIVDSYRRTHGGNPPDGVVGSIYLQHKGKAGFW